MNLELTTCHGPDRSNEINLRDLVQDVCVAELSQIYQHFSNLDNDFERMEEKLKALDGDIGSIQVKLSHLESTMSFRFTMMSKRIGKIVEEINELEKKLSSSNPTSPACYHNRCRVLPSQAESHSQLSPCNETHQPHEKYNHETAYPHTPGTSHCTFFDSSQDILTHARISSHQTNTLKVSFAQLLFQIQAIVLELPESLDLVVELSRVSSFLTLIPELECHVEQQEDRIRIQFRDGNHPESVHSELILHQNFHSS